MGLWYTTMSMVPSEKVYIADTFAELPDPASCAQGQRAYVLEDTSWWTEIEGAWVAQDIGGVVEWSAICEKPATFPPTIGSGAAQAVAGDDSRLTNARTPLAHTHPQADVTNLTADLAAKCASNDSRLSDERTPTAHGNEAHSSTFITAADVHARQHSIISASDHTFPGGTTNFLREDGTFAAPTATAGDLNAPETGSRTVETAKFHITAEEYQLTGTQELTIQGSGVLYVMG